LPVVAVLIEVVDEFEMEALTLVGLERGDAGLEGPGAGVSELPNLLAAGSGERYVAVLEPKLECVCEQRLDIGLPAPIERVWLPGGRRREVPSGDGVQPPPSRQAEKATMPFGLQRRASSRAIAW